jgi:hypothetical protein
MNNPVNATQVVWKHRLGLIPAKIGAEFAHKIGIAMPMEPPRYPTTEAQRTALQPVRTRLAPAKKLYEFGRNEIDGSLCPTKALPGATVYLLVQDFSRLETDLVPHVKWQCRHPDCVSARWDSKQELFEAHDDNRILEAAALADSRGPRAHVYLGVLEMAGHPGKPAKLDDKGKVIERAEPAIEMQIMLLSDET